MSRTVANFHHVDAANSQKNRIDFDIFHALTRIVDQCERIARKAISFDSDAESQAFVRDRIQKLIPDAYDGRSVD